jgi:hypothetical protein
MKSNFKELEKIVYKHFPDAKWNEKHLRWYATTKPNSKDSWAQPETLIKFDNEASKNFYSQMSSNSWDEEGNITIGVRTRIFENILNYSDFLNEKKPAGAPDWHDSDAPDAEGRFRDLSIKDLAAWLIKTRNKDVKKISGSLTQQIVFNRKDDPDYAEKMEKVRKEVYKQLGREDLLENVNESKYSGNISGDAAEYIAKELSYYIKGIIDQSNDKVTYFHLKDKSYKSKVIKTLKDVYGLDAHDGGTEFSPSSTIKFDNDQVLEAIDTEGNITCDNCEWSWNIKEGGEHPYLCHKCGHDNSVKESYDELENYMFFGNLENIKRKCESILSRDFKTVDELLNAGGHDWAADHIATAKESIDQVESFITGEFEKPGLDEAYVQIAGKSKPSGAQILAMVIIDYFIEQNYLKPGADKVKKELISDLQKVIMDNTF